MIGICMAADAIVKTFMTPGNRRHVGTGASNQREFADLIEKAGNHVELPAFRDIARFREQ